MIMTTDTFQPAGTHQAINPWTWQDQLGSSQAVLVSQPKQTLYVAGQCAVDATAPRCRPATWPARSPRSPTTSRRC